jgi:hypothetical protein
MVFGGFVKVRKSLYTQIIKWIKTILNHIDTRVILLKYESSCLVYRTEWSCKQNAVKYLYPTCIKKCEILNIDTQVILKKKKKTIPIQHRFGH